MLRYSNLVVGVDFRGNCGLGNLLPLPPFVLLQIGKRGNEEMQLSNTIEKPKNGCFEPATEFGSVFRCMS